MLHGATLWVNSLITVGSLTAVAGCGCTELSAVRSRAAAAEPVAKKKKKYSVQKNKKIHESKCKCVATPACAVAFLPAVF